MPELITRKVAFNQYLKLTAQIADLQRSMFNADPENFDSSEVFEAYAALYDAKDLEPHATDARHQILTTELTDLDTFSRALSDRLKTLFESLKINGFVVMSDLDIPFVLYLENSYAPLKSAIKRFQKITGDVDYKGAITGDLNDLQQIIDIFFWLGRCKAGPEYIFFSDTSEKLMFNICKYGNIHITSFFEELITTELLNSSGFSIVHFGCTDNFRDDRVILGRTIE